MTQAAPIFDVSMDEEAAPSEAFSARALIQKVRWHTGLTQAAFAEAYGLALDRLRELELGLTRPDAALRAYLRVIDRDPHAVRQALAA